MTIRPNITHRDIPSSLFRHMVIFGPSVFYLFGPLVINLAVRFSISSAVWIWPNVQVWFCSIILVGASQTFFLNVMASGGLYSYVVLKKLVTYMRV